MQLLEDLASPPAATAEPPTPFNYKAGNAARTGDLYRPADARPRAALVLVPGATPRGKDDPRLQAFARTLARSRFAVLVPEIAGLKQLRLGPEQAGEVAAAVEAFAARAGTQGEPALGLVAISYAAGPALLAALEHGADRHLRFVVLVGPYYDVEAAITYVTTGFYREGAEAPWRRGAPDRRAKWAFLESNAARVDDPRDRTLLREIARRKRRSRTADVAELAAGLGPEGRAVYTLVTSRDPARVPGLIKDLPAAVRSDIRALDVSRLDMTALAARLILVHGRDDPVIPASESRKLANAAAPDRSELHLVDRLRHVELGAGGFGDVVALWRAVYAALEERDAAPAPDL